MMYPPTTLKALHTGFSRHLPLPCARFAARSPDERRIVGARRADVLSRIHIFLPGGAGEQTSEVPSQAFHTFVEPIFWKPAQEIRWTTNSNWCWRLRASSYRDSSYGLPSFPQRKTMRIRL